MLGTEQGTILSIGSSDGLRPAALEKVVMMSCWARIERNKPSSRWRMAAFFAKPVREDVLESPPRETTVEPTVAPSAHGDTRLAQLPFRLPAR
mmetsp:Transcript_147287/g.473145  ORF Transcript_147287/g.473145 Transcript_147287/m.473145 type:complete len:93 (+) Transcript_147287:278-556(+)